MPRVGRERYVGACFAFVGISLPFFALITSLMSQELAALIIKCNVAYRQYADLTVFNVFFYVFIVFFNKTKVAQKYKAEKILPKSIIRN